MFLNCLQRHVSHHRMEVKVFNDHCLAYKNIILASRRVAIAQKSEFTHLFDFTLCDVYLIFTWIINYSN